MRRYGVFNEGLALAAVDAFGQNHPFAGTWDTSGSGFCELIEKYSQQRADLGWFGSAGMADVWAAGFTT